MTKSSAVFWAAVLATSFVSSSSARTVFLLSADGFAANYFPDSGLTTLNELKRTGTHARLRPPFPSLTFPSHATMATGCPPGIHGIVANRFIDKKKGNFDFEEDPSWMECEPVWIAAERQGVKTTVLNWPLSHGTWKGSSAGHYTPRFDLKASALDDVIEELKSKEHSKFFMIYLSGVDSVGHRYGPQSPERKQRAVRFDESIGRWLDRLKKVPDLGEYAVLLVSDHGMTEGGDKVPLTKTLREKKVPGVAVAEGSVFFLYLWDPSQSSTVSRSLATLSGVKTWPAHDFPKNWGPVNARMGDVIGYVDPPRYFTMRSGKGDEPLKGLHGYDPALPDMAGILFAVGDGIAAGIDAGEVDNIRIAATVARLLGISPPKNNQGKPIEAVFSK